MTNLQDLSGSCIVLSFQQMATLKGGSEGSNTDSTSIGIGDIDTF
ncbi:MAG: hypothetical protein AAFP19_18000 [Bacteroidota bacterium]